MTSKKLMCTILYALLESYKIIVFRDFILEIIEVKFTEKRKKSILRPLAKAKVYFQKIHFSY